MVPFMDGVQLPQGYRTTARRHSLSITKCPGVSGTHLINFNMIKDWNNLDLEATQQNGESSTLTTTIIGEIYLKCKCPVFIKIKRNLNYYLRDLFLMHSFPFFRWIKFYSGSYRQIFFHLGDKKVVACCLRQVVVLYSNDCMGIGLGGISIGCLRRVVIWQTWSYKLIWL